MEDYGVGILGLVFGVIYWLIIYLLQKQDNKKNILKSIITAIIVVGTYFILIRFIFNGFEEGSWEDTKRLIILISLLLAVDEVNLILKNNEKLRMKFPLKILKVLAAIYGIVIAIGMLLNIEQLLNFIDIINDIWGIGITLYTAFLIYVLRRNSNNDGTLN